MNPSKQRWAPSKALLSLSWLGYVASGRSERVASAARQAEDERKMHVARIAACLPPLCTDGVLVSCSPNNLLVCTVLNGWTLTNRRLHSALRSVQLSNSPQSPSQGADSRRRRRRPRRRRPAPLLRLPPPLRRLDPLLLKPPLAGRRAPVAPAPAGPHGRRPVATPRARVHAGPGRHPAPWVRPLRRGRTCTNTCHDATSAQQRRSHANAHRSGSQGGTAGSARLRWCSPA